MSGATERKIAAIFTKQGIFVGETIGKQGDIPTATAIKDVVKITDINLQSSQGIATVTCGIFLGDIIGVQDCPYQDFKEAVVVLLNEKSPYYKEWVHQTTGITSVESKIISPGMKGGTA